MSISPSGVGSVLTILAALLVFIFIKEPKQYEETEKQPSMFASLKELIKDQDKSGLRILLAIFFWYFLLVPHLPGDRILPHAVCYQTPRHP